MESVREDLRELQKRRQRIKDGGGVKLQEKQRAQGKMTARERIDCLIDPETFVEFDLFAKHVNPYYSATQQHVDDIIDPQDMRLRIIRALEVCEKKEEELLRKKHGNTPV